jgi:hypothetical protein
MRRVELLDVHSSAIQKMKYQKYFFYEDDFTNSVVRRVQDIGASDQNGSNQNLGGGPDIFSAARSSGSSTSHSIFGSP